MRHRKRGRKLNRTASHRKAMLANLATELFIHKQIVTTHAKALEARRLAERLITKAKQDTVHARRLVYKVIPRRKVIYTLFHEIAPKYKDRPGGYTRITKLGLRQNDRAPLALLSLVDFAGVQQKGATEEKSAKKGKGTEAESAESK